MQYPLKRRGRPPRIPAEAPQTQLAPEQLASEQLAPDFWKKGQLLNVRNAGPGYRVTILGEEYDPRYPERTLEFSNSFECQKFVSTWYSRQSHDPRA